MSRDFDILPQSPLYSKVFMYLASQVGCSLNYNLYVKFFGAPRLLNIKVTQILRLNNLQLQINTHCNDSWNLLLMCWRANISMSLIVTCKLIGEMPKLKQPGPLEKLAFDYLVAKVVRCCTDLCDPNRLTELHRAVADIKHHLYYQLPEKFFLIFCGKFLEEYYTLTEKRWSFDAQDYCRGALEMNMDLNVVGLTCEGKILNHLVCSDINRIQGLTTLDLSESWRSTPMPLDKFQFQHLTTLNIPMECTDSDLEIIGSRCSKLEVLQISGSRGVTNKGLSALRSCSNLRLIDITSCLVTGKGITELLNTHGKLEQLNVSNIPVATRNAVAISSCPTSPIYPSIKRFTLGWYAPGNPNVRCALAAFPNLTSLGLDYCFPDDFGVLKDLKNLTELKLRNHSSMQKLEPLLMDVGENIRVLSLNLHPAGLSQNDLDFIFQACRNLEDLAFDYLTPDLELSNKFVIPPFKKLRTLKMFPDDDDSCAHLEFGVMPALEQFFIPAFDLISDVIESMLLDDLKFPNLKLVTIEFNEEQQVDRINQIAKSKNIDFLLEMKPLPDIP